MDSVIEVLKKKKNLYVTQIFEIEEANKSRPTDIAQMYDRSIKNLKELVSALDKAILALEKQEKQLYVAYEQGQYDSLDYYGFFSTDEEAVKELTKAIGESFTSGNEYRFFKLDFSKKGIDTSLPVKEVLGVLK